MLLGILVTPFTFFCLLIACFAALVGYIRYAGRAESNLPLMFWLGMFGHARIFEHGYRQEVTVAGLLLGLLLRFEFMNVTLQRIAITLEFVVLLYVSWRSIGLILGWPDLSF